MITKEAIIEILKTNSWEMEKDRYVIGLDNINNISEELMKLIPVGSFTSEEILDEMDGDMEDSGMAQGEIESNINHWRNKYIITRRN